MNSNSINTTEPRPLFRRVGSSVAGFLLLAFMTTAWSQTQQQQSSTETKSELEASQSSEIAEDSKTTQTENSADSSSTTSEGNDTSKNNDNKNDRDPIGAGTDERFIPTEEISEDLPVSFPVDI